jgi:hypothetical protein
MSETNYRISRERMKKLLDSLKEPYKEHESELRRSIGISSGFVDKLATLSAGSIAVAASILLATVKSGVHSSETRMVVHDLLIITFLLWASLLIAIFHNFLAAEVAKTDAAISEGQFLDTMMRLSAGVAQEETPSLTDDTMAKVEDMIRSQMSPKQEKHVKSRDRLYLWTKRVGYLSMGSFVIAYTLAIVFLCQLW